METENISSTVDHQLAFEWNKEFNAANLRLCFKGDFNQGFINAVLSFWGRERNESDPVKNRVFSVLVESLQNISRHAAKDETPAEGIIVIGQRDNKYFVISGNSVPDTEVPVLKEKLEQLKNLSSDELKELHKQVLLKTTIDERTGGAGLGLINIARKSAEIEYDFKHLNNNRTFFSLQVII